MTKTEMAKTVLAMVGKFRRHAFEDYVDAVGKCSAETIMSSVWENDTENALARNPYKVDFAQKRMLLAKAELDRCDAIVEFVTHTFIDQLDQNDTTNS